MSKRHKLGSRNLHYKLPRGLQFIVTKFRARGCGGSLRTRASKRVPLKRRYFADIGSYSVKTVADRYRHAAYHNKHWWEAFWIYQHRWPWTTFNPPCSMFLLRRRGTLGRRSWGAVSMEQCFKGIILFMVLKPNAVSPANRVRPRPVSSECVYLRVTYSHHLTIAVFLFTEIVIVMFGRCHRTSKGA